MSIDTLALFISHLDTQDMAASTIRSHLSAISYVHKLNNWADPTGAFVIQKLLAACHSNNPCYDLRLPITKCILSKLLRALNNVCESSHETKLLKAMFALAFHAFLRVGEMTVPASGVDNPHNLTFSQIQLNHNIVVTFVSFKHSRGTPFSLTVAPQSDIHSCPVALVKSYVLVRGNREGPLFEFSKKKKNV